MKRVIIGGNLKFERSIYFESDLLDLSFLLIEKLIQIQKSKIITYNKTVYNKKQGSYCSLDDEY